MAYRRIEKFSPGLRAEINRARVDLLRAFDSADIDWPLVRAASQRIKDLMNGKGYMPVDGLVFREEDERLELVGNFEELYAQNPDPWAQSGYDNPIYDHIRDRLINVLTPHVIARKGKLVGLEIGCGHGHVVDLLHKTFYMASWDGSDISHTAVAKAMSLYPDNLFYVNDITKPGLPQPYLASWYNIVIIGQSLWYIMHKLDNVVINCHNLLAAGGVLVVSQTFLHKQRYGRNYVDGFDGLMKRFLDNYSQLFRIITADYDDSDLYPHNDGLLVLRRRGL